MAHGVFKNTIIDNQPVTKKAEPGEKRFTRMFPDLCPFRVQFNALTELGKTMIADVGEDNTNPDSAIPAGYTYLGQFIDHDISRDALGDNPPQERNQNISDLRQLRFPSLDLDSLYGEGLSDKNIRYNGAEFEIGETTPSTFGGSAGTTLELLEFMNDLPRGVDGKALAPAIGDDRNDENLAVAQTHLAFIKFHNRAVQELGGNPGPNETGIRRIFSEAKSEVVRHYQWIVLHDFVKRIILPKVYKDVIQDGKAKFFIPITSEEPAMPIEFAAAAYRMGHSMVRDNYQWNRVFNNTQGTGPVGDFKFLFQFTGKGGMAGEPTLPSNWIIDWRRFYNLDSNTDVNMAKRLDTIIARELGNLPMERGGGNLATRNLQRGSVVGLPSGQDVAARMGITGRDKLTENQIINGINDNSRKEDQAQVIQRHEFQKKTPLWFYILREAEHKGITDLDNGIGPTLGPVGSRIVAEVFLGLVKASRISILDPLNPWTPEKSHIGLDGVGDKLQMSDLIEFLGAEEINPIG